MESEKLEISQQEKMGISYEFRTGEKNGNFRFQCSICFSLSHFFQVHI